MKEVIFVETPSISIEDASNFVNNFNPQEDNSCCCVNNEYTTNCYGNTCEVKLKFITKEDLSDEALEDLEKAETEGTDYAIANGYIDESNFMDAESVIEFNKAFKIYNQFVNRINQLI